MSRIIDPSSKVSKEEVESFWKKKFGTQWSTSFRLKQLMDKELGTNLILHDISTCLKLLLMENKMTVFRNGKVSKPPKDEFGVYGGENRPTRWYRNLS